MNDAGPSTIVDMETIGERLRAVRTAAGLSQIELGTIAGVTKQAISRIETGETQNPEAATLEPICRHLKLSLRWMVEGKGPKQPGVDDPTGWDDVRGYAQAVGLGDGAEAAEYAETHSLKFRTSSLRRKRLNPNSLAVMYGRGDSMLPRIRNGDAILFDTSDTRPDDEALFVILCHGIAGNEYSAKRCRQFGDQWFFESLNPEGDHNWRKPRPITDKRHPIEILGRVRWIGSWEG